MDDDQPPAIVFNLNNSTLSKEEVGNAVREAIDAYERRLPWWRRLLAPGEWQAGYLTGVAVVCALDFAFPKGTWWSPLLGAVLGFVTHKALQRRSRR